MSNIDDKLIYACGWTDEGIDNILNTISSLLKQQRSLSAEYHKERFNSDVIKEAFEAKEDKIKFLLSLK